MLVLADAFAPALRPRFGAARRRCRRPSPWSLRWVEPLPGAVWSGALVVDPLARFVDTYILAALLLVAVMADPYLARTGARYGEFYGLLLWSAIGAMVMAKADSLLVVFVGLELLSISLYVLNAFHRDSGISLEAGWKYLVVGAFASAFAALRHRAAVRRDGHLLAARDAPRDRRRRPLAGNPLVLAGARPHRSPASASSSRWCRSTPGRPTSTRARRRR